MADDWPTREFPAMDTPMDLDRIAKAVREILEAIGEDPDRDGLRDTPTRVGRMYAEVCAGPARAGRHAPGGHVRGRPRRDGHGARHRGAKLV